jgi:hypothetical protein
LQSVKDNARHSLALLERRSAVDTTISISAVATHCSLGVRLLPFAATTVQVVHGGVLHVLDVQQHPKALEWGHER